MRAVRKAVITAAGRGTRQFPASRAVAKPLFPLVDRDGRTKPLIQILVEEAIEAGIDEVCIVVPPGQALAYDQYFTPINDELMEASRGKDWMILESEKLAAMGERLHFVEQRSPDGFGHAVYQARSFAGDDSFLLMLGDHVFVSDTKDRCARQLTAVYEEFEPEAITGVAPTPERQLHLFGTVRGEPIHPERGIYRADLIVEKPGVEDARRRLMTPGCVSGTYLTHFGMHIFSPRIFSSLEHLIKDDVRVNGEIQLTAAQEHLRQQTNRYWVLQINGQRYDTGIPAGYVEAQMALALAGANRAEFCESMVRIMSLQSRS